MCYCQYVNIIAVSAYSCARIIKQRVIYYVIITYAAIPVYVQSTRGLTECKAAKCARAEMLKNIWANSTDRNNTVTIIVIIAELVFVFELFARRWSILCIRHTRMVDQAFKKKKKTYKGCNNKIIKLLMTFCNHNVQKAASKTDESNLLKN